MRHSQHTPGPWHIGMKPGPMIYGPQGEQIADMRSPLIDDEENVANARLFAASPDLLEALEEVYGLLDTDQIAQHSARMDHKRAKLTQSIRSAIAKAKGE